MKTINWMVTVIALAIPFSVLAHDNLNNIPFNDRSLYIEDNPIYDKTAKQLIKIYGNRGGQGCLEYSEYLQGFIHTRREDYWNYDNGPRPFERACRHYQKTLPYSVAQLVDPHAANLYIGHITYDGRTCHDLPKEEKPEKNKPIDDVISPVIEDKILRHLRGLF